LLGLFEIVLANNQMLPMMSGMNSTKAKKFWSKKAVIAAVEECQDSGWRAGILGTRAPFLVQATSTGNGYRITYDLHTDGKFYEYSRKEVAA
jgi:CRISPR/Cas system endoribonuclease Cas6 (RAMP superfamily)